VPEKVFIDGQIFFDRTKAGYGTTVYTGVPEVGISMKEGQQ
jgi:hypothetical protein